MTSALLGASLLIGVFSALSNADEPVNDPISLLLTTPDLEPSGDVVSGGGQLKLLRPIAGVIDTGVETAMTPSANLVLIDEPTARRLIGARGYFGIKGLSTDHTGAWHGTAIRFGYGFASRVEIDNMGVFSSNLD